MTLPFVRFVLLAALIRQFLQEQEVGDEFTIYLALSSPCRAEPAWLCVCLSQQSREDSPMQSRSGSRIAQYIYIHSLAGPSASPNTLPMNTAVTVSVIPKTPVYLAYASENRCSHAAAFPQHSTPARVSFTFMLMQRRNLRAIELGPQT